MKHNHTIHLHIVYGCVCASTTAELKDCDRDRMVPKAYIIYHLTPLQKVP